MKKILIGLVLSFVLLPILASAETYYVDASRPDDSGDGLSEANAWKTISKVNSWSFSSGDIIHLKKGGKWEETLNPPSSGSSENPITFTYYGSGDPPEIKGTDTHMSGWSSYSGNIWKKGGFVNNIGVVYLDGEGYKSAANRDSVDSANRWFRDSGTNEVYIYSVGDPGSYYSSIEIPTRSYTVQLTSNRNYLRFDGIYFWSGITSGVYASGTYSYLDFADCTFHGAGTYTVGMGGTADHITFDNCQIHGRNRAQYNNVMEVGGPDFSNFVLKNSEISRGTHAGLMFMVDGFTIENNEFWSDGYGENAYGRNIDIYGAQNGVVRYNVFRNAGYGNGIVAGGDQLIASNVDIYYNIFKNGEYQGLQIWKEATTYNSWNVRVWNNVIYGSKGVGVYILAGSDLGDGIEFKNNIIFENDDTNHYQVRHLDPTTNKPDFANNCIYDSSTSNTVHDGTQPRTVAYMNANYDEWSDNIASDPECADPDNDFHLQSNSPCINNGTDVGLTLDFEGNSVPQGSAPDIGAYEYAGAVCEPDTYYVDATNGNDAWSGNYPTPQGSPPTDGPWKTISKVNSWSFSPGDTINFKRGETWSGTELTCDNSGNSSNYVTYQDYGSGNKPVLKNPQVTQFEKIIVITADWVKIRNLDLQDTHEEGVSISSGADNNIVEYCEMSDVGEAVSIRGQNNLIQHNYIHDTHMVVNDPGGDNDYGATGTAFYAGSSGSEVRYNIYENCRAVSYDYGYDGGAFEFFIYAGNTVSNIKIHHNWATGCEGFLETGGYGGSGLIENLEIYHNIGFNNYGTGSFVFHTSGTFSVNHDNIQVYNNVFIDTHDYASPRYSFIGFGSGTVASDFLFKNNIFYLLDWWYICDSDSNSWNWTHEYNCHYIPNASPGFTLGTGEINQDPKFMNLSGENFQLASDSPCIDKGTDVGLTLDFEGNPVPQGSAPDIGAYEYAGAPPSCAGTCRPNPCDTYIDCSPASGTCETEYCCSGTCNGGASGLVTLYHFDENSDFTAGDSSGNGNDGDINGAAWTNGISGYALEFDGLDDYVEIDATDLPTRGPFTISAWLNKTTSWAAQAAFSRWSGGDQVFEFQTGPGSPGKFVFLARTSDTSTFSASMDTAQLNEWYHVVGVADGNTASLYVNGVEYNGSDMGWNTGEPSGVVRIGMRPDGNYPFEGLVDEVRIYNRTLTEGEILELYTNPGGEQIPGDLNTDGKVDIFDLAIIAANFGKTSGFEPGADVVPNNEIDIFDVVFVASRFT